MKFEWKEVELSEIADLTVGFVGTMTRHYTDEGVLFLRSTNIEPFNIKMDDIKYISPEFNEQIKKSELKTDDVVIVRTGKPGACTVIPPKDEPWNCSDLVVIHPNKKKVNPYYLAAYINLASGVINANLVGAVQQHFNVGSAKKMKIQLPSLQIQNRIASIIQGLNKKIALNNKINENLEQQAQALYREMFLENQNITTVIKTLNSIAVITMGQSPSGKSYNEDGIGEVFYQGRAEFGTRFPTRRLFTTEPKRMAEAGDVLLSVRAPVGDLNVAYEKCCIGRGLAAVHSKIGNNSFILYTMMASKPRFDVFNGEGTVFGSINRESLNTMPIKVPSMEMIVEFENMAHPIDEMIRIRYEENCRLEILRNTLLPKLMNGEIDIEDVI